MSQFPTCLYSTKYVRFPHSLILKELYIINSGGKIGKKKNTVKLFHWAECSINPKIPETFLKDSMEPLELLQVFL